MDGYLLSLKEKAQCWERLVVLLRNELGMTEWVTSRINTALEISGLSLYDEVEMFLLNVVNKEQYAGPEAATTAHPRHLVQTLTSEGYASGWDG
jgi:hypothetical protein